MVDMKKGVDCKNENRGFATWGETDVAYVCSERDTLKKQVWLP